jgi:hypothetical protein
MPFWLGGQLSDARGASPRELSKPFTLFETVHFSASVGSTPHEGYEHMRVPLGQASGEALKARARYARL